MISQIKKATKELEDILSNDNFQLFKEKENHYNLLFENANISFFNTCKICYEINNYKSFCSCEVNFNYGLGVEKTKRIELKNYMDIFQNIDKNLRQFQWKTEIYKMDGLTDEEKYILSIEPLFDTIETETEKEEEFVPLKIDIVSNQEENDIVLSNEDLKILEDAFKSDIKNETELKNKVDIVSNKYSFIKDILLPIITYIFFIQLPLVIFISTFFFNEGNIFRISKEVFQGTFMTAFIGVLFLFSPIIQELKNERLKLLFSEKSFKIHFLISIILIGISAFQLLLPFAMTVVLLTVILYSKKIISFIKDKLK